MMNAFSATLETKDAVLGRFRSYRVDAGTDLLGDWLVDVTYGRIGTSGRRIRYVAIDESDARKHVKESCGGGDLRTPDEMS